MAVVSLFTLAASTGSDGFVRDLLVLMLAAATVSIFARRIRLPSIPGYLLVGAVVGGSVLGLVQSDDNVAQISDLAIVLLMFTIGLHLDTGSIRSGMVSILFVGALSTILSAVVIWPLAMAFGLSSPQALAVGIAFAMSSTAVVLGILQHRREVHRVHGRLCIGIALVQDLITIAGLAALPALATWAGTRTAAGTGAPEVAAPTTPERLLHVAVVIIGIGALVAFGRWVLPRLLREASRDSNTEALLVVSATVALASAGLTTWLGIGAPLGAFISGFVLASTPFRHQLAGQLSPLRDLFMAVFFTAVGINLNISDAAESWWIILIGLALLFTVKTLTIGLTTWAGGATASIAVVTACLLSQAGEFSLVILGTAAAAPNNLLTEQQMSILIAITVLSLILTTPMNELGRWLQPRFARVPSAAWIRSKALHEPAPGAAPAGHSVPHAAGGDDPLPYPHRPVIIAGFGVVGRNLAEHFAAAGIPYIVIELNPHTVIRQQRLGRTFIFGDVSNPDVLESAGVHAAEAVILTIPDDEAVLRACRTIRQLNPKIFIAARTSYLSRAIAATELGADYVTIEEVVTAQDMAKQVMERLAKRLVANLEAPAAS